MNDEAEEELMKLDSEEELILSLKVKWKSIIDGQFFKLTLKWILKRGSGYNSLLESLPSMSKVLIYMYITVTMVALSYS